MIGQWGAWTDWLSPNKAIVDWWYSTPPDPATDPNAIQFAPQTQVLADQRLAAYTSPQGGVPQRQLPMPPAQIPTVDCAAYGLRPNPAGGCYPEGAKPPGLEPWQWAAIGVGGVLILGLVGFGISGRARRRRR